MSELYRAFIVAFSLSIVTFIGLGKSLPPLLSIKEFKHWRLLWLSELLIVFFSPNIWVFFSGITIVLLSIPSRPQISLIYYLLLISAVPLLSVEIPGIGGIRYLFNLDYERLLIILLLIIPFLKNTAKPRLFSLSTDYPILSFIGLVVFLNIRQKTSTDSMRETL
jgi:hypothetical protein